jgi:membrane protease YdiL (CAAX protease family)
MAWGNEAHHVGEFTWKALNREAGRGASRAGGVNGYWGWFAVLVVQLVFVSFLGEDLLFRGLLLPRMRGVFGRGDFIANGVLFAFYHLHQPWTIPSSLADIILTSYPTRRWQSVWMSVIVHSAQSVFVFFVVLSLVLG